ncbi:MAG: hypothetical protein N2378_03725 [Chloroflexaceae bacterium]|nr:hypothetical protein [Chloroflexaceae bacterium]
MTDQGGKTMRFDERRWTEGAWLALGLGYRLGGVSYVLAAYQLPTEGWNSTYTASTGWQVRMNQGGSNLLRPGDRILAIAGQDVGQNFVPRREPPAEWTVGATARYRVLRDGAVLDLDVLLVQIAPAELPRYLLLGNDGTNVVALICLLFGFVVFLLRPGSVAASLLLLILTYFMGTATIWFPISTPMLHFFPPPLYWAYQGGGVLWPLLFAAATHLALAFRRPVWPLTRRPPLTLGLLYGLPAAAALVALITFSSSVLSIALFSMMLVMICATNGATLYNLRTTHDPGVRAQVPWVGLGFRGAFVLAIVSLAASSLLGVAEWSGYLYFLALPLYLGIAILCYRLFDIDVITPVGGRGARREGREAGGCHRE